MKQLFERITIKHILLSGLVLRLISVFFSPGYGFHDDHFEVIELAQKWRDGMPFAWDGESVHLFSLIYPGIHYLLFEACEALGIRNPTDTMLIVRLFHALFSLIGIYAGYLLMLQLTRQRHLAIIAGLVMALLWMFPFLSVRSLREFFCIPLLLIGSYYASITKLTSKNVLLSALFFVLAFCIRLQTIYIPLGIGIYWLFSKEDYKRSLQFGAGFFLFFMMTQGVFDLIHYGNPLASSLQYIRYNADPSHIIEYPQGPWYQYMGTLALICLGLPVIPLLWGYIRCARLSPSVRMLLFASALFFIFHSWYSNKQERFLLPFVPYFFILGIIGFDDYYQKNRKNRGLTIFTKIFIGWFLFFNTVSLLIASFTYSKKTRVESMNYLRKKKDVSNIIVDGITTPPALPVYYLGQHISWYEITADRPIDSLKQDILRGDRTAPNYVILTGDQEMEKRINRLKIVFPTLRHEIDMEPGNIDKLVQKLNPAHNKNETWHIYRID